MPISSNQSSASSAIRVMVTDDSIFMRKAITRMIETARNMEVVGEACDGLEAIEKAKALQPDIITLDIEMPRMDGLTALKQLKRVCKAGILMISSLTTEGSQATLTALRNGAADFIAKDASQVSFALSRIEREMLTKIRAIAISNRSRISGVKPAAVKIPSGRDTQLRAGDFDLLVIGSSTGGPPVLEKLLAGLPEAMAMPIVIAQHMPKLFTKSMSDRLNRMSALSVHHGESGMELEKGHVYIGQGGQHVRVKRRGGLRLEISEQPASALYKPSVNELYASAALSCGARVLGVMLTGMGDDGVIGAKQLFDRGGKIIAQDEASCVVYGMPRAVVDAELVIASLPPDQILDQLKTLTR